MKSAAMLAVAVVLLIVHVQGQARTSTQRCLCLGSRVNHVRLQSIDKIEVYPAGASCDKVEIIVTLKNGAGRKCLNGETKTAQNLLRRSIAKKMA